MKNQDSNARLEALKALSNFFKAQDKPLLLQHLSPYAKDLCFKVCRHYFALEKIISCLLKKPLKTKDQDLAIILFISLVQIEWMNAKTHAAVNECVQLASLIGKASAKGLINACLRHYLADQDNLARIFHLPKYQAPNWLQKQVMQDYPSDWERILKANQTHAPMFIRVAKETEAYLKQLTQAKIQAEKTSTQSGLLITQPVNVDLLPGFEKGDCSVQDLSPQLTPTLLDLKPNQRVLDACAAPGNKSAHLLECEKLDLVCLDIDATRLKRLKKNWLH